MKQHLALVEHLESAPDHWEKRRFRHCAVLRNEKNSHSDQPLLALSAAHGVRERGEGGLGRQAPSEGTISSYWKVRSGDLVVNPMWLIEGGISCSWLPGAVSPAYRVYVPSRDIDSRYLHHLMRSRPYIDQYNQYIRGLTTFDRSVSVEDFLDIPVLVPPLDEQRHIADFLDAEVDRIDRTVAVRSQQLELLGERWRSSLTSAVAGLGNKFGFVPMKYISLGVEQGWSPQCEDRHAEEGEWGVLKAGCVNGGFFDWRQHKALPDNVEPRLEYRVRSGDLLVSRASGSADLLGSAAVVPQINHMFLLCDKIYRISLNGLFSRAEFVSYVLASSHVRSLFESRISGGEGMANNLPVSVVKDAQIPNAPLESQDAFLAEMREIRDHERNISEALNRQVGLLEERKRALITAAVTGQIDVTTARGADLS